MPDSSFTVSDFLAYEKQLMGKLGRIGDTVADVCDHVNHFHATFSDYRVETDAFRIQVNQRLAAIEQSVSQGFATLFAHLGIQPSH